MLGLLTPLSPPNIYHLALSFPNLILASTSLEEPVPLGLNVLPERAAVSANALILGFLSTGISSAFTFVLTVIPCTSPSIIDNARIFTIALIVFFLNIFPLPILLLLLIFFIIIEYLNSSTICQYLL